MRYCYISKSYPNINSGGNKAKTDVEAIMDSMGFINIGLKQSIDKSKVKGFILTLLGVLKSCFLLKKGDILVLQYPLKKYYTFICKVAHLKGAKVVTLIHDLGAFRRKKVTKEKEKERLANSDYLIALTEQMRDYLVKDQGYAQPVSVLEMWDYLSSTSPIEKKEFNTELKNIVYVGALSRKKHSFVYKLDESESFNSYKITIYGGGFEADSIIHKGSFDYKGIVEPDDLITQLDADYGLVWYGNSIDEIDGTYGEYLKITAAHKPSLYLRCHIPVIVWAKSAQADFVRKHNVGICIDSLEDISSIISSVSEEEYSQMRENTKKISSMLSDGYFFKRAFRAIEENILANSAS